MINVIGLGYIGLPTALMLAVNGNEVVGTDYNTELVNGLERGRLSFKENGLSQLFAEAVKNGIKFSAKYVSADYYIVAVPTPYDKSSKKIDSSFVERAVKMVLCSIKKEAVIIIESTVSPKTIDSSVRKIVREFEEKQEIKVHLVHAPERIIPGNMIYELKNNSRTIGCDDIEIGNRVKKIYQTFCKGDIVVTDIRTAEMTKVVENTYRDINIAFANELAKICRFDNMDVYEIIEIANKHPRVNILKPGPGVGGHCISVDPWFLVGDYPMLANLILSARKINDSMPEFVLDRVASIMEENNITDISKIGLYGLTYKENVDDVRESPSLQLLNCMHRHLAHGMICYDPYIAATICENQVFDIDVFLEKVELVVVMVAHQQILDYKNKLEKKIVLDTRNCLDMENAYYL